ncbi:Bpu10I family restriction endonuclease, partial [Umezakia ovalisporum]
NGLRMSLTILGNEFIIIINYFVLILRPEFTIFWAIFITSFLTFNTCVLEGSSRAAEELKARNPNSLYIVLMEWIKLSSDVNLRKYKVDQIYVIRQQKNTDREFRYEETYMKNPINPKVVRHLFHKVRKHLTMDWTRAIEDGIQRGWLIEE